LMQAHGVPRQVNMDQCVTIFLKVYAFTTCLRRDEEPNLASIESCRRIFPLLWNADNLTARQAYLGCEAVAVDEGNATQLCCMNGRG
jgi:hypothetical protein